MIFHNVRDPSPSKNVCERKRGKLDVDETYDGNSVIFRLARPDRTGGRVA